MISFLFSIVDKKIFWDKVYQTLSQKYDDFEMVFAIKEQNPELKICVPWQTAKTMFGFSNTIKIQVKTL